MDQMKNPYIKLKASKNENTFEIIFLRGLHKYSGSL
jgi:hypothetical protein